MNARRYIFITLFAALFHLMPVSSKTSDSHRLEDTRANTAKVKLQGVITDENNHVLEFASVYIKETAQWAVTDSKGRFNIDNVGIGRLTLIIRCMGYVTRTMPFDAKPQMPFLRFKLQEENLKLQEVEVVAKRKTDEATTSYVLDKLTLDNQQIISLGDVSALLPGGKTVNGSLMSDRRLSLRSNNGEKGNASFGTAVDVDGVRVDNNAAMNETNGASTRRISATNIEQVEIVTGIPSVEYGDLSNGIVKVTTRKGHTPYTIDARTNPHTRQISVSKGWDLPLNLGMFNLSFEHARSFSDLVSPFTAYQRNVANLNWMTVLMRKTTPLTVNLSFNGNFGGYNSKADPDQLLDDYVDKKDHYLAANLSMNWLINKPWITEAQFSTSYSQANNQYESYFNDNSAATQAYIHTLTQGYFVAQDYDTNPNANIIVGPTGYWYVRQWNDSRPISLNIKTKLTQVARWGGLRVKTLLGGEWSRTHNRGRGTYYENPRYTPTWRPYIYNELPALNNMAVYLEERFHTTWKRHHSMEMTAGWRQDITYIANSAYGTVSTGSPRINLRYTYKPVSNAWLDRFSIFGGWGKSVKLPSFQVLYPKPVYADRLTFASTSDANNKAYYAYYTHTDNALYNDKLKWQYTQQTDIGVEIDVKGTKINLSAFYHRTVNPYMATSEYRPFAYKWTGQVALNDIEIPVDRRLFDVNSETGVVTVSDKNGVLPGQTLSYKEQRSYQSYIKYVNASPIHRYGLEWIVDFKPIKAWHTRLRLDGNYYLYKGFDEFLYADLPVGTSTLMSNGQPYQYVGYYRGSNATSTGYTANASVSNGMRTKEINLNATITTHIPKIRMIMTLRIESQLMSFAKPLSEYSNGTRGYVVDKAGAFEGKPYDGSTKDQYVVVYPEYYSTWEEPNVLIPFAEKFKWAKEHNQELYRDLSKLIVNSNYPYTMNSETTSPYFAANFTVTKEIGRWITLSFYANNFWNTMATVKSTRTRLSTTLFDSGYIPSFYYGLSLKLKL